MPAMSAVSPWSISPWSISAVPDDNPRLKSRSTSAISIPAIMLPPGSCENSTMNRIMTSMPPMYIMIWSRLSRSAERRMNSPATPMNEPMRKMPLRNMLIVVAMPSAPATAMNAKMTKAAHSATAPTLIAGLRPRRVPVPTAGSRRPHSQEDERSHDQHVGEADRGEDLPGELEHAAGRQQPEPGTPPHHQDHQTIRLNQHPEPVSYT